MNDHRPHGYLFRGATDSPERIVEQRRAESLALTDRIDGQASKDRNWDRKVRRQTLTSLLRRFTVLELTSDKGVVAADGMTVGRRNETACRIPTLALPGVADQPAIEQFIATTEISGVVPNGVIALSTAKLDAHARR